MLSNELPGPWQAATLVQNAEELQALAPYSVDNDVARASDDEFARCSARLNVSAWTILRYSVTRVRSLHRRGT